MTVRHLNYTGRKPIKRGHIRIEIRDEGGVPAFDVDLKLESYELPPDALVFIEAYWQQYIYKRFAWGNVEHLLPPSDRRLTEFDSPEGIRFRVRVTSTGIKPGMLLAFAEIQPREPGGDEEESRRSLLPVKPSSGLESLIWKIDYDDIPVLLVNNLVTDKTLSRSPAFVSLVLPAILRDILQRIIRVEKHDDTTDDADWKSLWLRFASTLPGALPPPSADSDDNIIDEWIDARVQNFCQKLNTRDQFTRWGGDSGV